MVAGSKIVGISQDIDSNDTFEAKFALMNGAKNLILLLKVENYADGTYNLELEHSPDGSNFDSLGSTAALSADGIAYLRITDSAFESFKVKMTSSGVTSGAKIEASLFYTDNRL